MSQNQTFARADIWMVDFGSPLGHEQGLLRPAVVVSDRGLANTAHIHKLLIVVPGTSSPQLNPITGLARISCLEVQRSVRSGLKRDTYFMAEQVRTTSTRRFQKHLGSLEARLMKQLEDRLCLVMGLFGC